MNYKVVSKNKNLLEKSHHFFTALGVNEAIHIQEVNFWLIDVQTMDEKAITSYKNRKQSAFLLFIVNNDEEIQTCLSHGFSYYIHVNFTQTELSSWHKFYLRQKQSHILKINDECSIDFEQHLIYYHGKIIELTLQEVALLKALRHGEFVNTNLLCSLLQQNSPTSVRTTINRIRNKTYKELILQKRNYGYALNLTSFQHHSKDISNAYVKELEEQNALIQEIVDSSPIFIATFVHKQLYCINKSFREFLGTNIIKELWDETKGDFFQLIEHASYDSEKLKNQLFNQKEKNTVKLYDFKTNDVNTFEVQTFYFENLDKHLLIFSKK